MAQTIVNLKLTPDEYDLLREALNHYFQYHYDNARDTTVVADERHLSRGKSVNAKNLLDTI